MHHHHHDDDYDYYYDYYYYYHHHLLPQSTTTTFGFCLSCLFFQRLLRLGRFPHRSFFTIQKIPQPLVSMIR